MLAVALTNRHLKSPGLPVCHLSHISSTEPHSDLSIALIALALALIWRTVGMIDFGLAAVYLIAAYTALILKTQLEWPFL